MAENEQNGQTEQKELTAEQKAALEHGRTADFDAVAKKQQAAAAASKDEPSDTELNADQKAKDEEARLAAEKAKADGKPDENKEDEQPPVEDDKSWQENYIQTGNEHADAAIDLMKAAGIKPIEANEIFKDAVKDGDLSKVRWDLLEARLGAAQAKLVKAGVEAYYEGEYKTQTATRDKAFEIVGGEANWGKLKAWVNAKEKNDPAFKAKVDNARKAIELGGDAAEEAVNRLKKLYEADPKNSGLGTKKVADNKGNKAPSPQGDIKPLSRSEYFQEKQKLNKQYRGAIPDALVSQLRARRQAGMDAGI